MTEEVIESDLVLGTAEKVAIGSHHDFGEAAEAEAVVEKVNLRFKAQNFVFEGFAWVRLQRFGMGREGFWKVLLSG